MPSIHLKRTDGEHNPNAVLTWQIVRELRAEYASRTVSRAEFIDEWAFRLKVAKPTVRNILSGYRWREPA